MLIQNCIILYRLPENKIKNTGFFHRGLEFLCIQIHDHQLQFHQKKNWALNQSSSLGGWNSFILKHYRILWIVCLHLGHWETIFPAAWLAVNSTSHSIWQGHLEFSIHHWHIMNTIKNSLIFYNSVFVIWLIQELLRKSWLVLLWKILLMYVMQFKS